MPGGTTRGTTAAGVAAGQRVVPHPTVDSRLLLPLAAAGRGGGSRVPVQPPGQEAAAGEAADGTQST